MHDSQRVANQLQATNQVPLAAIASLPARELIHQSDRGRQYVSIRSRDRLADGITASVGSVGDSYSNALTKIIDVPYLTEVTRHKELWRSVDEVEYATLKWVDWFHSRRFLGPIGYLSPAEAMYCREQGQAMTV